MQEWLLGVITVCAIEIIIACAIYIVTSVVNVKRKRSSKRNEAAKEIDQRF